MARSVARFLNGPPRIAPLFTDLDTTGFETGIGGVIVAGERAVSLTVHWVSVPHFLGFETNSFSVTLRSDGVVALNWGPLAKRIPEIVGITEGGGAADPRRVDLSQLTNAPVAGTTYEVFSAVLRPMDLSFSSLNFAKP